ncbi:MAG: hypothetical protein Q8S03_10200 [Brevundimonas sp.]|uniref:hypothetical protein n=1 Tax=Brevundimonas sp. TaxID=1871086 RepID=UPI002733F89D|nr:hypothetical protein [Brevundimonas sp.]MDP3405050.1 hypothetical protein [Brevundimonas sp.]
MSRREDVLAAIKALVVAALPSADVERNRSKAKSIGPGGTVLIEDGDPGEPEIDLSPLSYNYVHRVPLMVGGYASASLTDAQVLDAMLTAIGAAVMADRTLGGLCDFLETEAPDGSALEVAGAEPGRQCEAAIIAHYSTPSPL